MDCPLFDCSLRIWVDNIIEDLAFSSGSPDHVHYFSVAIATPGVHKISIDFARWYPLLWPGLLTAVRSARDSPPVVQDPPAGQPRAQQHQGQDPFHQLCWRASWRSHFLHHMSSWLRGFVGQVRSPLLSQRLACAHHLARYLCWGLHRRTSCEACPAGKVPDGATCQNCPADKITLGPGSTECISCGAGTSTNGMPCLCP